MLTSGQFLSICRTTKRCGVRDTARSWGLNVIASDTLPIKLISRRAGGLARQAARRRGRADAACRGGGARRRRDRSIYMDGTRRMLPHTRQPGGLGRRHFVSVRGLPISASMRGLLLRLSSMEVSDAGRPPSRTRSLTTFNVWNLIYSNRISGDLFPFNIV